MCAVFTVLLFATAAWLNPFQVAKAQVLGNSSASADLGPYPWWAIAVLVSAAVLAGVALALILGSGKRKRRRRK